MKERLALLWQHHRILVISVLIAAAVVAAAVAVTLSRRSGDAEEGTLPADPAEITEHLTDAVTEAGSDERTGTPAGDTAAGTEPATDAATPQDTGDQIINDPDTDAAPPPGNGTPDRTDEQTAKPPEESPPENPNNNPSPVTPPATTPPPAQTEPPTLPAGREEILRSMTLREKVYQLFVVFPTQISDEKKVTAAGEAIAAGLRKRPVGGVLYDSSNMVSKEQVARLLSDTQSYSRVPLIATCDEEGGRVGRLMNTVGTTKLDSMMSYRSGGVAAAEKNARTIAADMSALGFNLDLAPVADVWSNPANSVIGDRAYSDDFTEAAALVGAAVRGFHEGGVACTLKHFPGHGDTAADTHTGAAYVTKTLDELRRGELLPFQAGIDAGADAVMIGHLTVTAVSDEPALFSREIVTDLLRGEMGFSGVVITDGLRMGAVSGYSDGEIAVRAVKAGVDILLCPRDLDAAAEGLIAAVRRGEISESRINESVLRILRMKGV